MTSDEGDYLSSLVTVERGKQWSIRDCLEGNKDKGRKPSAEFINEINRLSNEYNVDLQHTLEMIEGLVSGLSSHASGIYIFKDGYIKQNSKMKTPRGDEVTAWEMSDSDYAGGLKYDSLTTECQDKLEVCLLEYLAKGKKIELQPTIRETYNKYLHPDVLDYDNQDMWDKCSNGQIIDLFQFITPTGGACIKKIQPHNLNEMANANSLMRISVKDGEQPIDKFLRYKLDISLWYQELKDYGITNVNEIKALEEILLINYGVSNTQEDIMELSMRPEISNFTLVQADGMRKIVAKKKDDDVDKLKQEFYECVEKNKNSINVANYVWEECIKPQLAYSFSRNHVTPYSAEALQEMNLYHYYPTCYWNCSTLAVNAGTSDDSEESNKTTNYGKIAKAIYRSINFGVPVLPPDINKSDISFTPIEENNTILFGLGGISGINQDIAREILENRPYESFERFYDHIKSKPKGETLITKSKFITLIKAGCFDSLNPNRIALMKWLCVYENPKKESLNLQNIEQCIEMEVLPNDLIRIYKFKKYVLSKEFLYCNDPKYKTKKHYIVESKFAKPFFEQNYMSSMKEREDYYYVDDMLVIVDKSLEKALEADLNKIKEYLSTEHILNEFNTKMLQKEYNKMVKSEDVNKWSFQATSFYHGGCHELDGVDFKQYNITPFNELPEEPQFIEKSYGKRTWKQYDISRICGIILDRNDPNHLVDILTPELNVVTLNIPQGQYNYYKQTMSEAVDDKKKVIDGSWLKRENIILVSGYRRNDAFYVKKYKNSIFQHSIALVDNINEDKTLDLILERYDSKRDE